MFLISRCSLFLQEKQIRMDPLRYSVKENHFSLLRKRIRTETVKPNRLKINLNFPGEILGGSSTVTKGTLNVKWLNGAVAKNLNSSVDYILKPVKTEFEKYGQYIFDDPISEFHSETVNIFKDAVDANGNASVVFDPGKEINAPGMLNAVFTAKASEPGGDESITQKSFKYAPYPVFVGINPVSYTHLRAHE